MAYTWHIHSRECLSTGARRARPRAISLGHSFVCQVRDSFFCIHGSNRMLMNKKRLAPWMWHHVYLTRPINIARHTHPTRSCHSLTSALLHMLQMACIRIQLNAYASRTPRMNESRRLHILAKVTFGFKLMPIDWGIGVRMTVYEYSYRLSTRRFEECLTHVNEQSGFESRLTRCTQVLSFFLWCRILFNLTFMRNVNEELREHWVEACALHIHTYSVSFTYTCI